MEEVLDLDDASSLDDSIGKVTGFAIKEFKSKTGKSESDSGTIELILVAKTDNIHVLEKNVGDVVAAFNLHQRAAEPVVLKIRFPDED